jgi:hypothetical protein
MGMASQKGKEVAGPSVRTIDAPSSPPTPRRPPEEDEMYRPLSRARQNMSGIMGNDLCCAGDVLRRSTAEAIHMQKFGDSPRGPRSAL